MRRFLGILILLLFGSIQAQAYTQYVPLNVPLNSKTNNKQIEQTVIIPKVNVKTPAVKQNLDLNLNTVDNKASAIIKTSNSYLTEGIIYQEAQSYINAINPQKQGNANSYYPGLRGPNQLVIYTPVYGVRTGTNEFGTEAIVENNMVVRLNGADSIIPKNGFVISGHGRAKTWITKNIQIGSKVYIDYENNSLKVFLTPESLVYAAKEKLREVSGLVEYYRQLDILYNDKKANESLDASKASLRKAEKKPEKTQTYITEAMTSLDDAIKNAIPYFNNELKGVWIRPTEKTPEQIVKTLERINSAGITDIFLEAYYHGKTIYPSKYLRENGVIYQRAEFVGFDPLAVWIKEAHERNMKVHIWFESFYVGNDNPQTTPNHVLRVYPSWANKRLSNYDSIEPVPSLSEHNGYFLDPSNIQVQTYLLGILKEIIVKYKPDGINLDYIRYPNCVEPSYSNYTFSNWGYTQNARENFKTMYGIDPINISYGTKEWELWASYRQNQITEFVKRVSKLTKEHNTMLTAVIFPDLQKSKATKMQNWKVWSMNNYVDGFTALILTGDKNTAVLLLNDVIKNTSPITKIYTGLFVPFMGGPYEDLLVQIHKAREFKTKGAILFDYAHLDDVYIDALKTRVFNKSYDTRDFKLKTPPNYYAPEVKCNEKKKEKKKRWRRKNGNN